jgi:hypothetical protein
MFVPFFALPLATQLIVSVADNVPKLDVTSSCPAAAASSNSADRMQSCVASEQKIHDQLIKSWSDFPSVDRANCLDAVKVFSPTYTELLTCLEMARDVKKIKRNEN